MVGTEQDKKQEDHVCSSASNTITEVSTSDYRSNSELVVLPKETAKNESEDLRTEATENECNSLTTNGVSFDEPQPSKSMELESVTEDSNKSAESNSVQASYNLSSNEKTFSNAYIISPDYDDRSARSIAMYQNDVIDISDDSDTSDSETSSTVSDDNEDSDNTSISYRSSSDKSDSEENETSLAVRRKIEHALQRLPSIEDLKMSVDEDKCKPVGFIVNIIKEIVVIKSFVTTQPLEVDTILFLDRGKRALGKIFHTFGPVHAPYYGVRFNSREHVQERCIRRELVVYWAPQTEFKSDIPGSQKARGSDASLTHDDGPSENCLDFSGDEAEARHKHSKVDTAAESDSAYVQKMNQKNLELTAKRRKEDEANQKPGDSMPSEVMSSPGSPSGAVPTISKSHTSGQNSCEEPTWSPGFFHFPVASVVEVGAPSSPPLKGESSGAAS